jgi:hypothetical protein
MTAILSDGIFWRASAEFCWRWSFMYRTTGATLDLTLSCLGAKKRIGEFSRKWRFRDFPLLP